MTYTYKVPDNLTPLEAELEKNAGDMDWYDEWSANQKGPDGKVPPGRCKEVRGAWANVLQKTFHTQIEPLMEMQKAQAERQLQHDEKLEDIASEHKNDRRRMDDYDNRLKTVEYNQQNILLQVTQSNTISQMNADFTKESFSAVNNQFSSIGDQLKIIGESKSRATKKSKYPQIPIYAWALMGAGAVGAVVFYFTGDDAIFKAMGSIFSPAGGSK